MKFKERISILYSLVFHKGCFQILIFGITGVVLFGAVGFGISRVGLSQEVFANILSDSSPMTVSIELIIQSTDRGKIQGTIHIENVSDRNFADLRYDLYLRAPETFESRGRSVPLLTEGMLLSFFESKSFDLRASEKKDISITIPYSSHIASGGYKLQAFIIRNNGRAIGGAARFVSLSGSREFLEVDQASCGVLIGGKEFAPNIGPNIDSGKPVKAQCKFTNLFSKPVSIRASIDYAERYVIGYPLSEKFHTVGSEFILFEPGESKLVSVDLPILKTPQVYEALLSFIDGKNEQVSPAIPFRWVIRGPSAHIGEITLDKDVYLKGETAKAEVIVGPSMDLFWRADALTEGTDLKNSKLLLDLYSGSGQRCGGAELALPSTEKSGSWSTQSISLKVERDCVDPKAQAKILEGGKILAEVSFRNLTSKAGLAIISHKKVATVFWVVAVIFLIGIGLVFL